MPSGVRTLGIDYANLQNPTKSYGLGGSIKSYVEKATISFMDVQYTYLYFVDLRIVSESDDNKRDPSLVGREILNRWIIFYHARGGALWFEPNTWDRRLA